MQLPGSAHVLLEQARRGELAIPVPAGYTHDDRGRIILDPDTQVQEAVRLFFQTFRRTGAAYATVKEFRTKGLSFPHRDPTNPVDSVVVWGPLRVDQALRILHNPTYAGAYCYGRHQIQPTATGRKARPMERDRWHILLREAHPGYVTWEEFEANQQRLRDMAHLPAGTTGPGVPREGATLLQGLLICGHCGDRLTIQYHSRNGIVTPRYYCRVKREGAPGCLSINAAPLDQAVSQRLLGLMTPLTLEISLAVQAEVRERAEEADRLRRKQVERAQYEVDLARRRYMRVDPDNRLVADSLESEWNAALRALRAAQDLYERHRKEEEALVASVEHDEIRALSTDFPRIWNDPSTPQRERKRMIRLLIEDITVLRSEAVTLSVRFKGGASEILTIRSPQSYRERIATPPAIIALVDQLLTDLPEKAVAEELNRRGMVSGTDKAFHTSLIRRIREDHGLKAHVTRLLEQGWLSEQDIAAKLGVHVSTVKQWRKAGLLEGRCYDERGSCVYRMPTEQIPQVCMGRKLTTRTKPSAAPQEPSPSSAIGAVRNVDQGGGAEYQRQRTPVKAHLRQARHGVAPLFGAWRRNLFRSATSVTPMSSHNKIHSQYEPMATP